MRDVGNEGDSLLMLKNWAENHDFNLLRLRMWFLGKGISGVGPET